MSCRKIAIGVAAILLGLIIVAFTNLHSLVHVKWNDTTAWLDRQVPVETQIEQLRLQVEKIDDEIKGNIGKLAKLEVDVKNLDENVAVLKGDQSKRKSEIALLATMLDHQQSNVAVQGLRREASELDTLVNTYGVKNEKLKGMEGLLAAKHQTLEAAHEKVRAMKAQRDGLALSVQKLETRKELVDIKTQQCQIEVSNDTINKCNAMVKKVDDKLSVQEKTSDLYGQYGYSNSPATAMKDAKNLKDVLNNAKKVLNEEGADQ